MEDQKQINKDVQAQIVQLGKHAEVANKEMGLIQKDIEWIKLVIGKMDKNIERVDARGWAILTAIILGFLISIYLK